MTSCEPLRFERSPESVFDYTIDWSDWITPGDTITGSSWAAVEDDGLTVVQDDFSDTSATVRLSGGVAGTQIVANEPYSFNAVASYYHVVNTIVTAAGCTEERTLVLLTKEL